MQERAQQRALTSRHRAPWPASDCGPRERSAAPTPCSSSCPRRRCADGRAAIAPPCRRRPRWSSAPRASSAASGVSSATSSPSRPGAPVAVLSGPSFADRRGARPADRRDAGLRRTSASARRRWRRALSGPTFRVYHATDLRGVEIGGAAKNVLAIACGIVAGRGLGESAKAALIARGFAELLRFARAYGGQPETLMGLSGLGDVVLTCASSQSRNFAFGERLGRGVPVAEAAAASSSKARSRRACWSISRARPPSTCRSRRRSTPSSPGASASTPPSTALMSRPLKAEREESERWHTGF